MGEGTDRGSSLLAMACKSENSFEGSQLSNAMGSWVGMCTEDGSGGGVKVAKGVDSCTEGERARYWDILCVLMREEVQCVNARVM